MDGTNIGPYLPPPHPHPPRQQKSPAWGQTNWKKHSCQGQKVLNGVPLFLFENKENCQGPSKWKNMVL